MSEILKFGWRFLVPWGLWLQIFMFCPIHTLSKDGMVRLSPSWLQLKRLFWVTRDRISSTWPPPLRNVRQRMTWKTSIWLFLLPESKVYGMGSNEQGIPSDYWLTSAAWRPEAYISHCLIYDLETRRLESYEIRFATCVITFHGHFLIILP